MTKPKSDPSAPPKGISTEAGAVWRKVLADYNLDDAAGRAILQTALESFDRMRQAQSQIQRDGITTVDRWGQVKAHPAIAIERDARGGMLAAFRLLRLDPGVAQ